MKLQASNTCFLMALNQDLNLKKSLFLKRLRAISKLKICKVEINSDVFRLRVTDLKAEYLKYCFTRNGPKVLDEILKIKRTESVKQYELDLTLAFWFAIHLEDLKTVQVLMQQEFLLKQLVACALLSKKGQNLSDDEEEGEGNDSEDPDEDEE
jgi:hypothetical protein